VASFNSFPYYYTMFALRCTKWIRYNFRYEHHRRKIFILAWSPSNAIHNEIESTSIRATMKELWSFDTFPMRSHLTTILLKLTCWHKAWQVSHPNASSIITIILCTKIIVNIKYGFSSCCCCFFEFLEELYCLHNFSKYKSQ